MASGTALITRSSTRASRSPHRYTAIYAPSPEHLFSPGIPARDLTVEEVIQYGVQNLRNSQCYQLVRVEPEPEPDTEESEE